MRFEALGAKALLDRALRGIKATVFCARGDW